MIEFLAAPGIVDTLTPLTHFSMADYTGWWAFLYRTFLHGIWARIFAAAFLVSALWYGIYRRLFLVGIICFILSFIITYLGGVVKMMFWWAT